MSPCRLTSELTVRELKQQGRRRLRKRHFKSEYALLQASSCLLYLVQFVKCWKIFLILNGLHNRSSGKKEDSRFLMFTFSKRVKLESFTSQSCNDCKEMYKKGVMHAQSSRGSKRFQSSYSAKVEAGAKKWKGEGEGRRGNLLSPPPPPSFLFFSLPSQRSRRTRAEAPATQATPKVVVLPI